VLPVVLLGIVRYRSTWYGSQFLGIGLSDYVTPDSSDDVTKMGGRHVDDVDLSHYSDFKRLCSSRVLRYSEQMFGYTVLKAPAFPATRGAW